MNYGFVLPGGSAAHQIAQAEIAESAGWDGVFVWEAAYAIDAWSLLAAISQRTSRIRLGTMLTPLPWRRPWKVASQVVTLDELSNGRAILAVGLGATDAVLGTTGEVEDIKERAVLLDEGIDVIASLWGGEYRYEGSRYDVDLTSRAAIFEMPRPAQQPRVPIWCVGKWPHPKSMRRVLRCDGLLVYADEVTPAAVRDMIAWLDDNGGRRPGFDVIHEGETPADDLATAAAAVAPWADAGCTWWLESRWQATSADDVTARIEAGPPRA